MFSIHSLFHELGHPGLCPGTGFTWGCPLKRVFDSMYAYDRIRYRFVLPFACGESSTKSLICSAPLRNEEWVEGYFKIDL